MIIYLEGPDGSGKSTLATQLSDYYENIGYNVERNGEHLIPTRPTDKNRITLKELEANMLLMANSDTIYFLDRGPISDAIYRMFDNYDPIGKLQDFIDIFKQINKDILLIYCRTDDAEKNMLKRGDDNPVAINKHKEITKAYDLIMGIVYSKGINMIRYDYINNTFDDILSSTKNKLTNFNL